MQRGTIIVRGVRTDGSFGDIDVLDLDEDSFRCFLLDQLQRSGVIEYRVADLASADRIAYRQRVPPGHPRTR